MKRKIDKIIESVINEDDPCWDGYEKVPGKKDYEKGSCRKKENLEEESKEDKKSKEDKPLNKPFRTPDGPGKFAVYVKNDKGNVVKVNFGDKNSEIKRDSEANIKSFRARHKCDTDPGPKWKARYWSCQMWRKDKTVTDILNDK